MADEVSRRDNNLDIRNYSEMESALQLAQYTVYKRYLNELQDCFIMSPNLLMLDEDPKQCIRALRLKRLCNKKGEDIFQKLSTVYHASMELGCGLFVMIDVKSSDAPADIYLGVRNSDFQDVRKLNVSFSTLKNGIMSNFPGTSVEQISASQKLPAMIEDVFADYIGHIASVSCVAAARNKEKTENKDFIQGIEKLVDSMKGYTYTALLIAEPLSAEKRTMVRKGYEELYSTLSPFRKSQWSYNESESKAVMDSLSTGISKTVTEGVSETQSHTEGKSESVEKGFNLGVSLGGQVGRAAGNFTSKPTQRARSGAVMGVVGSNAGKIGSVIGGAIGTIVPGAGNAAGAALGGLIGKGVGIALQAAGAAMQGESIGSSIVKSVGMTLGVQGGISYSRTQGTNSADATANSTQHSSANAENKQTTHSTTDTHGRGRTIQIENTNKTIEDMLTCIERHLKRLEEFEDYGAYSCGAYFMSAKQENCILAANTYKALMLGDGSGIENSAINYWNEANTVKVLKEYLKRMEQPVFALPFLDEDNCITDCLSYSAATMVGGAELPIHLGLPTKSIAGLPVYEMASFGREVYEEEIHSPNSGMVRMGRIFHMGNLEEADVNLKRESLSMHTFITGSTGVGKSNAIYQMLRELKEQDIRFLVVEPAKGEYKHIFGNSEDVYVYGTNSRYAPVLKINPFCFPGKIHVLEHIDRLIEIFNVCWPMYAAMPAVLKESVEKAYEACGWNLNSSVNKSRGRRFPVFADVLRELKEVVRKSAFSQEVKDNYTGSLVTRVSSLTNGLYGQIFGYNEIGDEMLFDRNVIVDLSRVGSVETKAMIMGMLVMRLQEYRMSSGDMNVALKHVTILEEAHNLLRRTSMEQGGETANLVGKSVEMLSNAIAEMRTYGEGFVIADQAPGLMDKSVIRNTNTKIILRLPDAEDRELVGGAAGLTQDQIKELAKLPAGVAAIYQNNWLEPVLCKIHYENTRAEYAYVGGKEEPSDKLVREEILQYALSDISGEEPLCDVELLKKHLTQSNICEPMWSRLMGLLEGEKPGCLDEVTGIVSDCVEDFDKVFANAMNAGSVEEWNRELLKAVNFEMEGISQAFQYNVLECIIRQKSMERNNNVEDYRIWMQEMGRQVK